MWVLGTYQISIHDLCKVKKRNKMLIFAIGEQAVNKWNKKGKMICDNYNVISKTQNTSSR